MLTFWDVSDCQVSISDTLDYYHLVEIRMENSRIVFLAAACINVSLEAATINGMFADLNEVTSCTFNKKTIGFR